MGRATRGARLIQLVWTRVTGWIASISPVKILVCN